MLRNFGADRFRKTFMNIAVRTGFGGVVKAVATEKDEVAVASAINDNSHPRYRAFRVGRSGSFFHRRAARNTMAKKSRRRNRVR